MTPRPSTSRTGTTRWLTFRGQQMRRALRDGTFRCTRCSIPLDKDAPRGSANAAELNHKRRYTDHPELEYDPGNVEWLCAPCHRRVTAVQNSSASRAARLPEPTRLRVGGWYHPFLQGDDPRPCCPHARPWLDGWLQWTGSGWRTEDEQG